MIFSAFKRDQEGGVAVLFAVSLVALCMVTGLAMTSLDVSWTRTETRNALDAGVIAGAAAPTGTSDAERIAIAERIYAANQIIPPHAGAEVEVKSGVPANFGTTETTVYGVASITRTPILGGLFGVDQLTVGVTSAATKVVGSPICLLGLDPTEEATMDFNGHASLELTNCASMANSASGAGLRQVGQPQMKAKAIGVTGGYSGSAYEPLPMTNVAPIEDPLASLPEPVPGACNPNSDATITNETITLQPGTYCGGLSLQAGSVVTLEPGIYIMKDGLLNIQAGAVVTAYEVMIAFLGPTSTLYLIGDSSLTLTSPTSGTYKNIQFFGDRNVYAGPNGTEANLWFTVIGGSELTFDGVLYMPSFHAWFAGHSTINATSPGYLAIAKKFWFQDQTSVVFEQDNKRDLDEVEQVNYLEKSARLIQ